ncbi:hypothetical protein PMNALOAF_2715 [Methylobacterium adhaesivum]|nr:hypothetical protein PMNALOAF_2715 [Methylobacterium adhaesivum]
MKTRVVNRVPEWRFQAEVVARLHKMEAEGCPLTCAGDMAAAKRSQAERQTAKATGLMAGETDVRVYIVGGRLLSIELKAKKGSRSKEQKDRHARLEALGFEVMNPRADTPEALADLVEAEVRARLPAA